MNFFEEQFDLLNHFQVVDSPPPRMEDILSSSTVNQSADTVSSRPRFDNKAFKNKHCASVFRSINLMQPKPKFVFIPTPSYTSLANDADMIITRSVVDRSVSCKRSLVGSRSNYLNTMPKIEPADELQNTTPMISWLNPKIEPKTKRARGFLQYNAPWNNGRFETMKQKWPKIKPGYDFQDNSTTPWNSIVPVTNWKQKQPKLEASYGVGYSNPWNSVLFKNVKKKQPKMEPVPAHDFRYNTSSTSTVSVQLYNHRCTICGKAFPSPQSLGGHMSAHVRKNNKRTPNGTVKENNQTMKRCKREYY